MVSETSLKCYKEIIEEGLLGRMEERIFHLIHTYPMNSDREIAEIGHLKINQITARRNALMEQGCVVDGGTQEDKVTGRTVHIWIVPEHIQMKHKAKARPEQKRLTKYMG